mmetsp:Transcript_31480/g.57028  ORF Transcript_31480/g.57028 Transcript_31480/m.57028 type:complete len:134 (-) Transcript_31480:37-438(-)
MVRPMTKNSSVATSTMRHAAVTMSMMNTSNLAMLYCGGSWSRFLLGRHVVNVATIDRHWMKLHTMAMEIPDMALSGMKLITGYPHVTNTNTMRPVMKVLRHVVPKVRSASTDMETTPEPPIPPSRPDTMLAMP